MSSIDPNTSHKKEAARQTGSATLTLQNKQYELPVFSGTHRPRCGGHPQALRPSGHVHLRPRLHLDRRDCKSNITYIDGDKGVLLYRGYPIDQLAEHCDFLETCYLLLYGELPTAAQKDDFDDTHHPSHDGARAAESSFFRGFRRDAHPMAIMCGVVGALSAFYHDSTDINDPQQREIAVDPPDRQDADHRGDGLQIFASASPSSIRRTSWATPRTSCA